MKVTEQYLRSFFHKGLDEWAIKEILQALEKAEKIHQLAEDCNLSNKCEGMTDIQKIESHIMSLADGSAMLDMENQNLKAIKEGLEKFKDECHAPNDRDWETLQSRLQDS